MLTKNFYLMMAYDFLKELSIPSGVKLDGSEQLADWLSTVNCFSNNWSKARFIIGTGTKSPNVNDYNLENAIKTGYTITGMTKNLMAGSTYVMQISGIITNTSDADITFSEVGLILSTYGNTDCLFAREVYDTPITIAPGESVAVNVNIM